MYTQTLKKGNLLSVMSLFTYSKAMIFMWILVVTATLHVAARIETISVYQMQYAPVQSMTATNDYIYCATKNGILIFDIGKNSFIQPEKEMSLIGKNIHAVVNNPLNAMLLAFSSGKVFLNINNIRWLPIGSLQGVPQRYAVAEDATYIGNSDGVIYQISYQTHKITVISQLPQDVQWKPLHNPYTMPVYDPHTRQHVSLIDYVELPGTEVFAVTDKGEVVFFDRYRMELQRRNDAVFERDVYSVIERDNIRYTAGKDIWRTENGYSQKINIHGITGVFTDMVSFRDTIAVSSRTNGIYIINDTVVEKNITMGQGLFDNTIVRLAASSTFLFALSPLGVTLIDAATFSTEQKRGTDFMNISVISVSENRCAFVKHDGIRITDSRLNVLHHLSVVPAGLSTINTVVIDDNLLYIGGKGGLSVMDMTDYSTRLLPQPSGTVTSLSVDDVSLFVGTENGFYIINKKTNKFQRYGIPDGLLSRNIQALYKGVDGIYLQTDKGFNLWTR